MLRTYLSLVKELEVQIPVTIGGSLALWLHGQSSKLPGDLDLVVPSGLNLDSLKESMTSRGWEISYEFPQNRGFDLRLQFVKDTMKVDVFVIGIDHKLTTALGFKVLPPEAIWAARGYYAGRGVVKAQQQIADMGWVAGWKGDPTSPTQSSYSGKKPGYSGQVDPGYSGKKPDHSGQVKPTCNFVGWLQKLMSPASEISIIPMTEEEREGEIGSLLEQVAGHSPERYKVGALYLQDGDMAGGYNITAECSDHAEVRAIESWEVAAGKEARGGIMYCTLSPCTGCHKYLQERGIEVRYLKKYTGNL